MTPYRFHPAARAEYVATLDWYAERSADAAAGWIEAVERALGSIREMPRAWPMWRARDDVRLRVLRRFPYSIVYALRPDDIVIIAVAHQRRRPGYWQRRLAR